MEQLSVTHLIRHTSSRANNLAHIIRHSQADNPGKVDPVEDCPTAVRTQPNDSHLPVVAVKLHEGASLEPAGARAGGSAAACSGVMGRHSLLLRLDFCRKHLVKAMPRNPIGRCIEHQMCARAEQPVSVAQTLRRTLR